VAALLHEIDGFDHTGMKRVGTPSLFGMNFQAVSVGEKTVGYEDGSGAPTPGSPTPWTTPTGPSE
jgi:hypothetical protein